MKIVVGQRFTRDESSRLLRGWVARGRGVAGEGAARRDCGGGGGGGGGSGGRRSSRLRSPRRKGRF